ncbi:hypothetical protein [Burkholderia cenocepacia]|uniref:hypothetical protein n=1 Tax=Burkholderia cenocepacia TaxID=95486 RepID=UPI002ABD14F7|nr:hypothetical protein [Burkholderia cenocepacia]
MLSYPDQLSPGASQTKMAASTVPAPASEIDKMMARLLNLVSVLDGQQQEIDSRLRSVLAPPCPLTQVQGAMPPETMSAHGASLADLGTHLETIIDRNCDLLNRIQL